MQPASASACNAYNRRVLTAESLTSVDKDYWRISPYDNKDFGDMGLIQGVNRFMFHGSTHQASDQWPGYFACEGQKFHRNNPWFNYSHNFIEYYANACSCFSAAFFLPTCCILPAKAALPTKACRN